MPFTKNNTSFAGQIRWLPVVNGYAGVIPAFGLVAVTGCSAQGVLTVNQPTTNGQTVLINGPFPIAQGGNGSCTPDTPNYALYNVADGTPAVGETWGAGAASFNLRKNNGGFTVLGGATAGRVMVESAPSIEVKDSNYPVTGLDLTGITKLIIDSQDTLSTGESLLLSQPASGQAKIALSTNPFFRFIPGTGTSPFSGSTEQYLEIRLQTAFPAFLNNLIIWADGIEIGNTTTNNFRINGSNGVSGTVTNANLTIVHGVVTAASNGSGGGGSGTVNAGTAFQIAFYPSSGTTVNGASLSSLMDSILGSNQGDIIYRDSSAWNVLTPSTSGKFLQTQGPAANPQWGPAAITSHTVTLAALTTLGTQGSITITNGLITAVTDPT